MLCLDVRGEICGSPAKEILRARVECWGLIGDGGMAERGDAPDARGSGRTRGDSASADQCKGRRRSCYQGKAECAKKVWEVARP